MRKLNLILLVLCLTHASLVSAAVLKGQLSAKNSKNYKVLALAQDGLASITRMNSKSAFSATVKNGVSLHLVNSNGRYAGPIVYPKGTKAFPRLNGKGGNVGVIKIRSGFAVVSAKAVSVFNQKYSVAFNASKGPLGAGKLGLVRASGKAKRNSVGIRADSAPGGDKDKDGIPNTIDVDANGDGQLDVTQTLSTEPPALAPRSASTLRGTMISGLNAHLAQITPELIDASIQSGLILGFGINKNKDSAPTITAVNVDCLGLPYCTSPGGTATLRTDALSDREGTPWLSYDPDGDGYPNLAPTSSPSEPFHIGIRPKVTRAGLHSGDTIVFNMSTSAGLQSVPVVLPFFFVTVPALKEYRSGGVSVVISYPASEDTLGNSPTKPILLSNSSVALTFWKPQRAPIEGAESGSFIDMGHLEYKISIAPNGSPEVVFCEPSDFTDPSSTLQAHTTPMGYAYFTDTADDVTTENGEPLLFTLNAAACLARHGFSASGQKFGMDINADSEKRDETSQTVYFQLP